MPSFSSPVCEWITRCVIGAISAASIDRGKVTPPLLTKVNAYCRKINSNHRDIDLGTVKYFLGLHGIEWVILGIFRRFFGISGYLNEQFDAGLGYSRDTYADGIFSVPRQPRKVFRVPVASVPRT